MPAKKTPAAAAEVATKKPDWFELYRIMADASDKIIKSVIKRDDVPKDVRDLLYAALTLREVREMCWAEGDRLSPTTAVFWAKELCEWTKMEEVSLETLLTE
jgi:hypothetical protein